MWLSSAGAFCVSEAVYEYVMRGEEHAPEQTLPCCSAASHLTTAAQKDSPLDGDRAAVPTSVAPIFNARAELPAVRHSPMRWRSYCERSARLLQ